MREEKPFVTGRESGKTGGGKGWGAFLTPTVGAKKGEWGGLCASDNKKKGSRNKKEGGGWKG